MAFNATATAIVINSMEAAMVREAPILGLFSIDSGVGESSVGQPVKVRFRTAPGNPTRFDPVNDNYENGDDPDLDETTVTLLQPLKKTKAITAMHLRDGASLAGLVTDLVDSMYLSLFTEGMAFVTAARFGAAVHTGAATTLTPDVMATLKAVNAAQLGWYPGRLKCALESTYYANILKDDELKSGDNAAAQAQLETGEIRRAYGWTFHNAPSMPTQDNLRGIITDGTGLVMASAIDAAAPGVEGSLFMNQVIRKPGLPVIQVVGHASPGKNASFLTVKSLTTIGLGRAAGLKRIVSA